MRTVRKTALPVSSRRTPGGNRICAVALEEAGNLLEGAFERWRRSRLEQHVVVEQAELPAAGAGDADG